MLARLTLKSRAITEGSHFITYMLILGSKVHGWGGSMHLGTRILQARNLRSISQSQLAGRAGLAASYLSRIENRKIDPRPKTLRKIAEALGIPLAEFFREGSTAAKLHECVVTQSGTCIMDSLRSQKGRRRKFGMESYSPRQLQLLRMSNYLILNGNERVLDSLDLLFSSLMTAAENRRTAKGLVSISLAPGDDRG
jgi:transcriptional regulator with XRE-family HTH domain